jgi:hypothetical protein
VSITLSSLPIISAYQLQVSVKLFHFSLIKSEIVKNNYYYYYNSFI